MNHQSLSLIVLLGFLILACSEKNQPDEKSTNASLNFIFILADDLGYGDLRCYNAESKIPTPNLDQLALEGMRFTDAHTPSSVCTPTRFGFLTGQYAWRSPLKRGVLQSYDRELIPDSLETIAEVFQKAGYHTAHIGKWHLGYDWQVKEGYPTDWPINGIWRVEDRDDRLDFSNGIPGGPINAGFDYSFGFDAPNFPPFCFWENGKIIGELPQVIKPASMYGNEGWMQEGWQLQEVYPDLEDKALDYLEELAEMDKPFFLYLPLSAPHVPLLPTQEAEGKSQAGLYGDFVVDVDDQVGKIRAKLKDLGIDQNTILVFTSDNGSPARIADPYANGENSYFAGSGFIMDTFNHYPNGDWNGLKGCTLEGGHRVPMLVHWPEKIEPGTTNNQLVCLTDWITFAYQLLDIPKPSDQAVDSYNLMATITDPNQGIRDQIVHHSGDGKFAIRQDDWKLILAKNPASSYLSWYKPELSENEFDGNLFNLADDPKEE
ncbi:MAG: arylsulfatase, partial [Bacteroidota bacterium]